MPDDDQCIAARRPRELINDDGFGAQIARQYIRSHVHHAERAAQIRRTADK